VPKTVDELDLRILKALSEDCRKSTTAIAKEVGTSRQTAIARMKRITKKEIVDFGAKIIIRKLGLKLAAVHFEAKKDQSTEEVVKMLKKCPRVIQLIQITGKPTFNALIYIENAETLLSTIDCFSAIFDLKVSSYQRVQPLIGESFTMEISIEKCDTAPCGRECGVCLAYQQNECAGCPSTKHYEGPT